MAYQQNLTQGISLTRENFTSPPLEMGIVPFWFWNGELDYDEMEWQLREYYDKGVRSLFLHGRMGLKVPYLSDEWFKRVKFAVAKGKEIGIDVWVYDEMDWPSGTAEGQVLEADPDLSQRYLELVTLELDGPIFTFLEAHDDRYVNTGNSHPVAAYGVTREEYETSIGELVDLNKHLSFEKTIPWEAPQGQWMLLYFLEKSNSDYIDTLNPASTEKFLELTHDGYKKAVGQDFGGAVPGFFTDEPAMYYYHVGLKNHVVPWSKQMFKIFRERRGYDLKPYLPALYADMGDDTARIRYDFWRTLTEQYAEMYYGRIREWCETHDVIFTGHLLFEEHLRLAARCEGNIFKYLKHLHMTGVDHLYPRIGSEHMPEQHVSLKVGSSAAHQNGSARLLCESMGGTYWDCTLERMKWINNWEYVLGVNLFNNHGYHYSIEGERKRDWPPSQFYHHTWWKYYDRFTDYNARLSHLLSGGRHVAKVAMLYPINSIWTNYTPQATNRIGDLIEADFAYLTDTLLRLHYDFDYVDEDVLAEAEIENGKIKIADEAFSVFILPPVTHIKESTYEKLQAFVESGGTVIADTLLPVQLLETSQPLNGQANGLFGADARKLLGGFEGSNQRPFETLHTNSQGNVYVLKGSGLYSKKLKVDRFVRQGGINNKDIELFFREDTTMYRDPTVKAFLEAEDGKSKQEALDAFLKDEAKHDVLKKETLRDILDRHAKPDVTISDEDIFYLHRVKDGYDVYFFVNTGYEDKGAVTVTFEQVARPELWDANSGETTPMQIYDVKDDRLTLELAFPPCESHVVVMKEELPAHRVAESTLDVERFDGKTVVGYGDEASATVITGEEIQELQAERQQPREPILFPEIYDFEPQQDNALLIGHWKMHVADESELEDPQAPAFDDSDWLDVTNGAWEMQLPQERDQATYPVKLWYRTSFEVEEITPNTRLMIDGFSGSSHRLFVNGEEVSDPGERSWLDAEIREVDIQSFLREGRNVGAVELVAERRTDGILDLLKIVGPFALNGSEEEGYGIFSRREKLDVGDWAKQGYPFFSGSGVYSCETDVPEEYQDGGRLFLEADCGDDVLAVRVNGSEERVAPWHPYRIEITDLVQAGKNAFEIEVVNTLINLLEGEERASGLFAPPRLVHEHRYELVYEGRKV